MRKPLTLIFALVLAVSALAVSACGGDGDSDEDQVRELVQQLIDSDPAVCDNLTGSAREEIGSQEDCEKAAEEADEEEDAEIDTVEVDGDTATVEVKDSESGAQVVTLTKDGDEWLVEDISAKESSSEEEGTTTDEDTSTTEEDSSTPTADETAIQGTLDAFFTAVEEEDEQVLCGLLTPRLAAELVGGDTEFGIARCVEVFRDLDWSDIQSESSGVTVDEIEVTGGDAEVTLSSGETVALVRQEGRWVINRFGAAGA